MAGDGGSNGHGVTFFDGCEHAAVVVEGGLFITGTLGREDLGIFVVFVNGFKGGDEGTVLTGHYDGVVKIYVMLEEYGDILNAGFHIGDEGFELFHLGGCYVGAGEGAAGGFDCLAGDENIFEAYVVEIGREIAVRDGLAGDRFYIGAAAMADLYYAKFDEACKGLADGAAAEVEIGTEEAFGWELCAIFISAGKYPGDYLTNEFIM